MTKLEARVIARNRAGQVANELYEKVAKILRPFMGEKVLRADGSFLAKIQKLLPKWDFPDDVYPKPTVMVYRNSSDYSIVFVVKVCKNYDEYHCVYQECSTYIADLKGLFMNDVACDPPSHRTDFSATEIAALREDYKTKKTIADNAHGALFPFGEYDH